MKKERERSEPDEEFAPRRKMRNLADAVAAASTCGFFGGTEQRGLRL